MRSRNESEVNCYANRKDFYQWVDTLEAAQVRTRPSLAAASKALRVMKRKPKAFGTGAPTGRTEWGRPKLVPGPGEYEPKEPKGGFASAFSHLTSTREEPEWLHTAKAALGPGIYDVKSRIGEGPRYGISARRREERPNGVPGPGTYFSFEKTIAAAAKRDSVSSA